MPFTLSCTSAPTTYPVTAAEAMTFARAQDGDGALSTLFDSLIIAATAYVQNVTNRQLMTATYKLYLDRFGESSEGLGGTIWTRSPTIPVGWEIRLPRNPVQSVDSIVYYDINGTSQTLSASYYQADLVTEPARVVPSYGNTWPGTRAMLNAIAVTFTAGYSAASAVPEEIKTAIKRLVTHLFDHPEMVVTGTIVGSVPHGIDTMLHNYRTWGVAST